MCHVLITMIITQGDILKDFTSIPLIYLYMHKNEKQYANLL